MSVPIDSEPNEPSESEPNSDIDPTDEAGLGYVLTPRYENGPPIRERLLTALDSLVTKHRGRLVVLGWDVQLIQGVDQETKQPTTQWALLVLIAGALLGPQHYLSYVWAWWGSPQVPDDRTLEQGVKETFNRLHGLRRDQLRNAAGGGQQN